MDKVAYKGQQQSSQGVVLFVVLTVIFVMALTVGILVVEKVI
jgi:hypothetical protein